MKVLAIIPARGGSKGLPNKNILPLVNHPLIAYSIRCGLLSEKINRVIVSTDSNDIASIAKKYGAEVPFIRPAELAQDMSTDLEVFEHALNWLQQNDGYIPDIIVQLRPTSPIRFVDDVNKAIDLLNSNQESDSLRAITISPNTPYKMWCVEDESKPMQPLLQIKGVKEPYNEPRQRLPKVYWQTGTLDIIKINTINVKKSMTGDTILPYIIDQKYAIDIDDMSSFGKAADIITNVPCVKFL